MLSKYNLAALKSEPSHAQTKRKTHRQRRCVSSKKALFLNVDEHQDAIDEEQGASDDGDDVEGSSDPIALKVDTEGTKDEKEADDEINDASKRIAAFLHHAEEANNKEINADDEEGHPGESPGEDNHKHAQEQLDNRERDKAGHGAQYAKDDKNDAHDRKDDVHRIAGRTEAAEHQANTEDHEDNRDQQRIVGFGNLFSFCHFY